MAAVYVLIENCRMHDPPVIYACRDTALGLLQEPKHKDSYVVEYQKMDGKMVPRCKHYSDKTYSFSTL